VLNVVTGSLEDRNVICASALALKLLPSETPSPSVKQRRIQHELSNIEYLERLAARQATGQSIFRSDRPDTQFR
jgi:hypothetical protein